MNHVRFTPAAALAAAAIIGLTLAAPAVADPARQHGPIQPRRNNDGSLKSGPHFTLLSSNWAGYAVANFQTGQTYHAATLTWQVAPISFGQTLSEDSDEYAASWVGIGGYCTNASCTTGDPSLIQLGTQSEVTADGVATYSAWLEMLPKPPVAIPIKIHAGDVVTASLQCTARCSEKKQAWTLSMTNLSSGKSWSDSFPYTSSQLSVEWIEEAPVIGGVLPLANFGVAPFGTAGANGTAPILTFADNGIAMADPWGQIAVPSEPDAGDDFDVFWAYDPQAFSTP
ncbi:MAG TPA: G1 family glutamic endopeptidase [Stellaceae bacterium]|nr:G1 family glutamic endopeptidase [Stellaceae bacterium]